MREVPYELYLEFSSKLPCKDMFYFLNSLYVQKGNQIYAVKSKEIVKSKDETVDFSQQLEKEYNRLKEKMIVMNITEFLKGVIVKEKTLVIDDLYYRNKNIIVEL